MISSSIMLCIASLALAGLCFYNIIKCRGQIKKVRKYGHIHNAEIISYQKRRAHTSASGRYTMITWHDITVKIEILNKNITYTISTTNIRAHKYKRESRADVAVILLQEDPPRIDKVFIIEDLKSSPEVLLSTVLFIFFSVLSIISVVALFI